MRYSTEHRGLLAATGRLLAMVTSPIWVLALGAVWLLTQLLVVLPHWLWTGEEL